MKQQILICGATGFIGRTLAHRLAARNDCTLHAVRFNRPEYPLAGAVWHRADLRDPAQVDALASGMDVIIQAAATTSGARDIVARPSLHVADNAVMNTYLFRAAAERGVRHVVFFSCSVMYQSSEKPLKESDFDASSPLHPRYFAVAHTKLYLEKMCEFYAGASGTKFTAIRHSNVYGPHDKFDLERSHVLGATISKVMTAQDHVTVWGTGEEARDLLYADDLADFVEAALARQSQPYRLYHCATGRAVPVRQLVQRIITASGRTLAIRHDLSAPTIQTSLCLDCSLAGRELGWRPKTTLDEGIARTLAWWREHIDPATLVLKSAQKAA